MKNNVYLVQLLKVLKHFFKILSLLSNKISNNIFLLIILFMDLWAQPY